MKQVKHILFSLFAIGLMYSLGMFALKTIKYKQKPVIFVTNDYYNWKGGDTYLKYREFNTSQLHDVVFAGSSRAYRGYSPYIFGNHNYNTFNLGTSAQSIKNTYFVVKHYIDMTNCKVLLLDVFAGAFTKNQLESSSDLIENISKPIAAYDIAWHNKEVRTINLAAFRYLSENDSAYFKKEDYKGKGYSSKADSMPKNKQAQFFSNEKLSHKTIEIDDEQISYFDKIITMCHTRGVKLVCVYSPVSYFYDYSQHNNFISLIKKSIEVNDVTFYDFSKLKNLNTAYHFYDDSHLNEAGVSIFNEELIKQLQTDNLIKINATN